MTIQANQGFGVSVFGAVSGGGGGSTSPGGSSGQVQYNNGGAFGGMSGTTWTDASQSLAIASTGAGTGVTTSSPVLNLTQTWNAGAVTFSGIKLNVTASASAGGSKLLDIQQGGSPLVLVTSGNGPSLRVSNVSALYGNQFITDYGNWYLGGSVSEASGTVSSSALVFQSSSGIKIRSSHAYGWVSGTDATAAADLVLTRANTATLQLGAADAAAPVAQTLLIQSGSGTDINGVAFNIGGSKSTGTGTAGLVNIQTSSRGAVSGTSQNVLATVASFGPNTLSGSQAISLLDMAQTWNTSGAPTAIKLNVTNTSSPTNSFLISLQTGGTNQFAVRADNGACFIGTPTSDLNNYTLLTISNDFYINSKSVTAGGVRLCSGTYAWAYLKSVGVSGARFQLGNATPFGWTDNAEGAAGTFDTILTRDAANTLALRNGTNAQRFNVYNTYTSSTNYETFKVDWITTANTCLIGTEKGSGGGTARALALQTDGTTRLTISAAGAVTLTGTMTGVDFFSTGANGYSAAAAAYFFWSGRSSLDSPSDGVIRLANSTVTDFGRLQFGGTTSSFPALKRISSGNCLQVIGADNSASAGFIVGNQALATSATDGFLYVPTCAGTPTGTPTTQTGTAPIVVDTTNNKLYFYSGGAWRDAGP